MENHDFVLLRFNRVRWLIISFLAGGFLVFPFFGLLQDRYKWLSAIFVVAVSVSLIILIGFWYRCPYCKNIPRGDPIPYIDLMAKRCSSCGRSLRGG